MAVGESINGDLDTIEIIDLETSSSTCSNLPNYPLEILHTFGSLNSHGLPLICGGFNRSLATDECYVYDQGRWNSFHSLNIARHGSNMIQSTILPETLLVTGGISNEGYLKSAEVFNENKWLISTNFLPANIAKHCAVLLNTTTLMVIGSQQNAPISNKTFLLNLETEEWVTGPSLNFERFEHSCGRIKANPNSSKFEIIVVGGFNGTSMSSVEIFDEESFTWRSGPELPFGITDAELVEDSAGGVILIAGFIFEEPRYLDTLFRLAYSEAQSWALMPQKLGTGRKFHTAFLIPDQITDCSFDSTLNII